MRAWQASGVLVLTAATVLIPVVAVAVAASHDNVAVAASGDNVAASAVPANCTAATSDDLSATPHRYTALSCGPTGNSQADGQLVLDRALAGLDRPLFQSASLTRNAGGWAFAADMAADTAAETAVGGDLPLRSWEAQLARGAVAEQLATTPDLADALTASTITLLMDNDTYVDKNKIEHVVWAAVRRSVGSRADRLGPTCRRLVRTDALRCSRSAPVWLCTRGDCHDSRCGALAECSGIDHHDDRFPGDHRGPLPGPAITRREVDRSTRSELPNRRDHRVVQPGHRGAHRHGARLTAVKRLFRPAQLYIAELS